MLPVAFEERIEREPMSGCWLWTGTLDRDGYAKFGGVGQIHRVIYAGVKGVLLEGSTTLDHTCNVRCCVNPDHMDEVPHLENVRRAVERRAQREPVCPRCGGEWSQRAGGGRRCLACAAQRRANLREVGFE